MRRTITKTLCIILIGMSAAGTFAQSKANNVELNQLFEQYYEDRLAMNPLDATAAGDNRYNNLLFIDGSQDFLKQRHDFNTEYKNKLASYATNTLSDEDKISHAILMDMLNRELDAEQFHKEYMPFAQFYSLPLLMGQLGNGKGNQPFKTAVDYDNWLERIDAFTVWTDTTIVNFRKGIMKGMVLPKVLVEKMIPQMEKLTVADSTKSIFYGPVRNFPANFTEEEKAKYTQSYHQAITTKLLPAYTRLKDFFRSDYLEAARTTSGMNDLPAGAAMYRSNIYYFTTTRKTPEEIYQTGLSEVSRIQAAIEKKKEQIGFKGSLQELFEFMQNDPQFKPFTTEKEVLDYNNGILAKITPKLNKLFSVAPKAAFEVRAVEAFRAATASAQYNRPSEDGTRPGIFYIPILDAKKMTNFGMESLFIHEAIPGHHYQISLQQENKSLPKFRRFAFYAAYSEGWALYSESLGDALGCYTDPYQKIGAYGAEIHRAIRLVVDVALHTGKMTREEAIKYMVQNESISEQKATAEIERYMAMPGQALSYKIGELKIIELRDKYQKELGKKFSIKAFHDALLQGGAMPLSVLETYMALWAKQQ